jgi:hypothetical protein
MSNDKCIVRFLLNYIYGQDTTLARIWLHRMGQTQNLIARPTQPIIQPGHGKVAPV